MTGGTREDHDGSLSDETCMTFSRINVSVSRVAHKKEEI
jgi:hypothetical protein